MCNLYSITTNQAAIAALFRVVNQYVGNLPPMPGVFPDYPAPEALYIAMRYLEQAGGKPKLDQAADGFGSRRVVGLRGCPPIQRAKRIGLQSDDDLHTFSSRRRSAAFLC